MRFHRILTTIVGTDVASLKPAHDREIDQSRNSQVSSKHALIEASRTSAGAPNPLSLAHSFFPKPVKVVSHVAHIAMNDVPTQADIFMFQTPEVDTNDSDSHGEILNNPPGFWETFWSFLDSKLRRNDESQSDSKKDLLKPDREDAGHANEPEELQFEKHDADKRSFGARKKTYSDNRLKRDTQDVSQFTLDFGKEAVGRSFTLFDWDTVRDLSYCFSLGRIEVSRAALATSQDPRNLNVVDLVTALERCVAAAVHQGRWHMNILNITDPDGQVIATTHSIAGMLKPVASGTEIVDLLSGTAFDLVWPGFENTTRIVKWMHPHGDLVAGTFSMKEALAVRRKLMDNEFWATQNCARCDSFLEEQERPKRDVRARRRSIAGRGIATSVCCAAPEVVRAAVPVSLEQPELFVPKNPAGLQQVERPVFKSLLSRVSNEAPLVAPPAFKAHDWLDGPEPLAEDLNDLASAVLKWPAEVMAAKDSIDLFESLRTILGNGQSDEMWQKLSFEELEATRFTSLSTNWLRSTDPDLKPYQDWANAANKFAIQVTADMMSLQPGDLSAFLQIFYTPADTAEDQRSVVLDEHVDQAYLIFASADQPGLVIRNGPAGPRGPDGTIANSRIMPQPNTFQILVGGDYAEAMSMTDRYAVGTEHAVYGPEIRANGRISFTITVDKAEAFSTHE